jgi:hypothetical protein
MNQTTPSKTCPACQGKGALNNANGQAQMCPVCEGEGKVSQRFKRTWYDLVFPKTVVVGNAVQQVLSFIIPSDYDIEIWDIVATYTDPRLQIILQVNSLVMMNTVTPGNSNGVDILNWAGTAQLPASRRFPFYFPKHSLVALKATDLSGSDNTLQVSLRGFQLIPADTNP